MEHAIDSLFKKFNQKGFLPVEIPGLVKDAIRLFKNDRNCTIANVDRELEELGWGIGIIDHVTFNLIHSLVENIGLSDVEKHIDGR